MARREVNQLARALRDRLASADHPGSLARRARDGRWTEVLTRLPDLASLRVVDLGGTVEFWVAAPVHPVAVTVVNLEAPGAPTPEWIETVQGDACRAVDLLNGQRFDLAFSNSTIEHVGGHARCEEFASAVAALAPRHWIQTPYRYFPLEPHWLFPGFQFLPAAARCEVARRWPLGWASSRGLDVGDATSDVLATVLLGRRELSYYFPDSEILSERVLGVTKSLVALR